MKCPRCGRSGGIDFRVIAKTDHVIVVQCSACGQQVKYVIFEVKEP